MNVSSSLYWKNFLAGNLQKHYRHAQFRGLPYPILWIAETFTIDYESIHIGRYYRQAGWLSHIFLWYLFDCCSMIIIQMILFHMKDGHTIIHHM